MKSSQALKEIGIDAGLSGRKLSDFEKFFKKRFADTYKHLANYPKESYACEWAQRFRDNREWDRADNKSKDMLKKINEFRYTKMQRGLK